MQEKGQGENRIYFDQVGLKSSSKQPKEISQSSISRLSPQQLVKMNQLQQQYNTFSITLQFILECNEKSQEAVQKLCKYIGDYTMCLVKYQQQQVFFQHAVQKKFIALLLDKMQFYKFSSDIVKIVFSSLQFLLRGIKKQDQYVYFMVCINKEGFLTTKYEFQEDDSAYFANFMKLLTRKINQDEKYLSIFINQKQPEFPLLLKLLRFHDQKDQILRTSVKLTLIQISSNQSKLISSFINNFPFVMFYPVYVYQIYNSFLESIQEDERIQEIGRENLKTTLKFMQDFIQSKDRQAIEMYANCFMSLIGRYIYKELSQLSSKTQQRVIRILRVLDEIVVKDITVLKIKIGMGQFFTKSIGKHFHKFLKSKTHHIDFSYWLIDECKQDVHKHCQNIYLRAISQGKKTSPNKQSFLKTFNSYIPHSRDNWLFHQLKKISQLIGFDIQLNKEINCQEYLSGSYLKAIQLDTKGQQTTNQVYHKLIVQDHQEVLFYYLKLVTQLKVSLKKQGIDQQENNESVIQLLSVLNRVTALSVLKAFYRLILQDQIYINETKNPKIKTLYQNVLEKMIYFIITEGWNTFINRTKISLDLQQDLSFSPDIFRDLQCDILFFVALRHILGTKNFQCMKDSKQLIGRDIRRTQTKANCLLMKQCEDNTLTQQKIEIILDGQYIKLMDSEMKSISQENILVNRSYIYQSEQHRSLEIVLNENNESPSQQYYCVSFPEEPIKNYVWKEIKWRKEIVMDLELKLRLMMFEFNQ